MYMQYWSPPRQTTARVLLSMCGFRNLITVQCNTGGRCVKLSSKNVGWQGLRQYVANRPILVCCPIHRAFMLPNKGPCLALSVESKDSNQRGYFLYPSAPPSSILCSIRDDHLPFPQETLQPGRPLGSSKGPPWSY